VLDALARRDEPGEAGADDRDVRAARPAARPGRGGEGAAGVEGEGRRAGGRPGDDLAAGEVRFGHGAPP